MADYWSFSLAIERSLHFSDPLRISG